MTRYFFRPPVLSAAAVVACLMTAAQPTAQPAPADDVGGSGQERCARFPEVRRALVVGNSNYLHTTVLNNPANDSVDMAGALEELCFDVTLVNDVDLLSFERELRAFRDEARGADLALVFYAGHGIEIAGRNYLIPVDAELMRDVDVEWEAVDLDRILRATAGATRQIVILDACRDNPLARSMQRSVLSRGSPGVGLAPPGTIDNQLVAYAASAGNTAGDGRGRNSPYSAAFLQHLQEPGLEINILFGKVRDTVRAATEAQQVPGFYNQLPGEPYYLNPGFALAADAPSAVASAAGAPSALPPPADGSAPGVGAAVGDAPLTADDSRMIEGFLQGQMFADCVYCPLLTVVPPGSFFMGAAAGEMGREEDEGPVHVVAILRPLAVGTYEVSFREWDACVDRGGCRRRPGDENWGRFDRPVINVNWSDAQDYVEWLSEQTGAEYRLLSEAEWEYVARAGTGTARYWDELSSAPCDFANSADLTAQRSSGLRWPDGWTFSTCDDTFDSTAPTGAFSPNRFRLHDLLGNVWEWTQDCWNDRYVRAPDDGRAWESGDCRRRVVRGGAWNSQPTHVRAGVRDGIRSNARTNNLGFRVARTLEPPEAAEGTEDAPGAGPAADSGGAPNAAEPSEPDR